MKNTIKLFATFLLAMLWSLQTYSQSKEFEISKNIDIYSTLFKELRMNYVDEISPGELNEVAIDAMLEALDPYTVYISESEIEDYKFMTTGQYGGIGALIQKREKHIIISEPYKGFPADKAGLMAGDRIISIDGKEVKGMDASQVSELMKGEPGSSFEIVIERPLTNKKVTKTVTREEIKIDDIPYYGMLENKIGYINLRSFTDNSGKAVADAFEDLKENHGMEAIILDLRNNGGGLLHEAVNILDVFLDKGELVVETKGKLPDKNKTYKTRRKAIDSDIPVAVLINDRSASASEIVSGALQDLDRGVLIGERTFGKGLVQNILPLSYNTKAKVTVAKYYIPSGRCIQEIDYSGKDRENGNNVPDSLVKTFETKNGRKVYDSKGIRPDIEIKPKESSRIAMTLYANNHIFDFATQFKQQHDTIAPAGEFEIDEEIYDEFIGFLNGKEFEYTTETEKALENLKEKAKNEDYLQFIEDELQELEEDLNAHKKNDLQTFSSDIKELLRNEIVTRYYYQEGAVEGSLKSDKQLEKAMEVLSNQDLYQGILSGEYKADSQKE